MVNEELLVQKRMADWNRLEELVRRARGSVRSLTAAELAEMIRLYRSASADLAQAASQSSNPALVESLNTLVAHAYSVIYRPRRRPLSESIQRALWVSADTVRRRIWAVALAAILFFGSALLAVGLSRMEPEIKSMLVPPMMEASFEAWRSGEFPERDLMDSAGATTFYAVNNPRVAIIVNGLSSATLGAFAVVALWQNGSLIGLLADYVSETGKLGFLLGSIFPHGVPEIGGIFIACA
ncbi:MAG: stage II sporulation protein M, partial [Fimbriimonadaceae bacterium]|nr:stage II sporulation protein M [Fimbriimonadaceae bacterium]